MRWPDHPLAPLCPGIGRSVLGVFANRLGHHLSSGDACQPRSSSALRQGRRGMTAAAQSDAAGFPVREGERPWTDSEISQVRWQLADEADELRAEIGKAESSIADRL